MAYSYISYSADGSTNTFAAPVYISKSHVAVTVDGVATTFTWPTLSTVTLTDTAASLAGKVVEVRRTTPRTARLVDFQDAANITESMLDTSALQQFYIAQEVLDDTADKLTLASDGSYDALTHKIKNLADGTADQDAVTYAQLVAAALVPITPNATNIAVTPVGSIASTNVQAALEEVATEAATGAAAKVAKHTGTVDNIAVLSASGEIGDSGINKLIRYESVRQTVVAGAVDANGQANFLSAGTGLAVSMAATTTPVVVTFANGEDEYGQKNYRKRFVTTEADYWTSLAASNISYLMLERNATTGVVAAYTTLVPPQYGPVFDKTRQAVLHFEAADASTTMTDDYENAWTAYGNAQIDTAQFKLGTASLLLDGTGDYVENTTIASLGIGSWGMEAFVRFNALPTAAQNEGIFQAANAGGYGVLLGLNNSAGVYKLNLQLSSNGTTSDIANTVGTSTTWSTGTWYHLAVVYDAAAGKYYVYKDGVAEAAFTTTSAARICAITKVTLGTATLGTNILLNGWLDEFRISAYCPYPAGTTFTPPTVASTPAAEWFDTSEFKWKFGSPTSWAEKQRVCVGEVTTNATVPTATTTYALRGSYVSPRFSVAINTNYAKAHNLGVVPLTVMSYAANLKGGALGAWLHTYEAAHWGAAVNQVTKTSATLGTGATLDVMTSAAVTAQAAEAVLYARRGW